MSLDDYEELRDSCPKETHAGSEIQSHDVYVSTRGMVAPTAKNTSTGRKWFGRLKGKSFAVSIEDITIVNGHCACSASVLPTALTAHVIVYECTNKPDEGLLFARSSGHRGTCNRLQRNVKCKILQALEFIPQPNTTQGEALDDRKNR